MPKNPIRERGAGLKFGRNRGSDVSSAQHLLSAFEGGDARRGDAGWIRILMSPETDWTS